MVQPLTAIPLPVDKITSLCPKYGVRELAVFGSVLEPARFSAESDVDFLVAFEHDDYGPWMSKLLSLEMDLTKLLGRRVEVVSKRGIEQSRNAVRRSAILQSAQSLYVAG